MTSSRWDETWHQLREWTNGSGPSERLAAQILQFEGYSSIDPSHPLGGPDGGRDAVCQRDGRKWIMAVYFPRGQVSYTKVREKFLSDMSSASSHAPDGIAFVTNQELTLSQRESLRKGAPLAVDLFHLERITTVLDHPNMGPVRQQFLGIAVEEPLTVNLGGIGGFAPGSGGGGGGAIGDGARGGDGGPGGKIIYAGSPGMAPGAGGGGVGAEGDGAHGGNGGGGGDMVHLEISPEKMSALRAQGFHRMEFRVGQGGKGGPGEDSIINLVTEDGRILESVTAKGGLPGRPPSKELNGRTVTQEDLAKGFQVSSALLAECVHVKNGFLYLLGAGWSNFHFQTLPFEADWPLCLTFDTGSICSEIPLMVEATVRQPDGFQVLREPLQLHCNSGEATPRINCFIPLRFTGSVLGVWVIEIRSGDILLRQLALDVRGPS